MRKTAGSIRTPRVDVVVVEEAADMPIGTLSMILVAAHSSGAHVIGTFDTHQLQPVSESSGMTISRDNVDRKAILEQAVPTCFHVFARTRDNTIEQEVDMHDGLLYILAAGDERAEAQNRAGERFGGGVRHIILALHIFIWLTRETVLDSTFRGLLGCNEGNGWNALGGKSAVGAKHRDLGNWARYTRTILTTSPGHLKMLPLSQVRSTGLSACRRRLYVERKQKTCSTPRGHAQCTPSRAAVWKEGWSYIRPDTFTQMFTGCTRRSVERPVP